MTDSDPSPIVVTVDQPPIGHDAALWSGALADLVRCPLQHARDNRSPVRPLPRSTAVSPTSRSSRH
ncbi:hypothetical protein Rhow_007900 [Rhodococcus wratislaviensis]|uniref:Uncharacterized protein n=1 Tax=Rhodococcus wratislaviensis TaxID=44752 RepID=A0A402CJ45_RHOWR|nr:hypothetical protein Rhow_007900 [Rhodococcus wratislaviensis]